MSDRLPLSAGSRHITDAMVERAARALCDLDNEHAYKAAAGGLSGDRGTNGFVPLDFEDWRDEFIAEARAALIAALEGGDGP